MWKIAQARTMGRALPSEYLWTHHDEERLTNEIRDEIAERLGVAPDERIEAHERIAVHPEFPFDGETPEDAHRRRRYFQRRLKGDPWLYGVRQK